MIIKKPRIFPFNLEGSYALLVLKKKPDKKNNDRKTPNSNIADTTRAIVLEAVKMIG